MYVSHRSHDNGDAGYDGPRRLGFRLAPVTHGPEQSLEEDLGKRKLQAKIKKEIRLGAALDSYPILNTGDLFTWSASWSMSPKWAPQPISRCSWPHTHTLPAFNLQRVARDDSGAGCG